jgi:hypothetical protein
MCYFILSSQREVGGRGDASCILGGLDIQRGKMVLRITWWVDLHQEP